MCRLFGFRSVMKSGVHTSLTSADNALMLQSTAHPDGWGVSYYVGGAPHVIKSVQTAVSDNIFQHVSGIVTSDTVLAHLRKATQGSLNILNTHPFQYGHWCFAHNGNIPNFDEHRETLLSRIPAILRGFILGKADSEVIFYLLLGKMRERGELEDPGYPIAAIEDAARATVAELVDIAGPICEDPSEGPDKHYLTFIITNGRSMLAHQGGQPLFCSTHKRRCSERDTCPYFKPACERPDADVVSHLLFSSEPLQGENVWHQLRPGETVGTDWNMRLHWPQRQQSNLVANGLAPVFSCS